MSRRGGRLVARTEPVDRLDELRAEEALLAEVERTSDQLRGDARAAVGVTGDEDAPSLRDAIRTSGASWYPLSALGLLVMVDEFQAYTISVLGPEISAGLGISKSALAFALVLKTLAITVAVLPMAAFVQRRPRRASISIVSAIAWSLMTIATGFVASIWGLLLVMVIDGFTTGSVRAVHQPLLVDTYPPEARVRVLSAYRAADGVGSIIGPLLVGVIVAVLGYTWRGVFVGMGVVCLVAALFAARLRDPGFGRFDTDRIRRLVNDDRDVESNAAADLGFFDIARRLMLIPTIRHLLAASAVLGMLLVPLTTYLAFFLQERWGMGAGERALFSAFMPVFAIAGLAAVGKRGEELFRRDPARIVNLAAVVVSVGVSALAIGIYAPFFALMVVLIGVASAGIAALSPLLTMVQLSIVPSQMRPHMAALSGIFLAAIGGGGGLILLSGVETRFGTAGAILSLALPGVIAGFVLRAAARTVNDDLDRMLAEIVEAEEVAAITRSGGKVPMLSCRGIDFSYGQLQVLFGVDFTVDDGEIVALLGTNGAGKSTVLRVISGLGLPHRGTVRMNGIDITYMEPQRRVQLGISQVPGGRGVFGPMSVAENLRVLAYSHGRDRRSVEQGIEASFDAFPRLAERRNQLASTLSGGEQQMLGLATAFILRPRLLLIDELSLGLAPKIVGELLDMVRRINDQGTAIVLVEQSVNVALSVVEHAYFMEKGEVRFDGRASELLGRPDLLRSVFLEGAKQGLGPTK
jgi:ABC-type branched-subunit amino acid transport system ATPase component/sugar phosphate permease